ncbi:kinase-like domain-containing protein [Crepidotus variabilis]|uniref:Kinase-like domain-containing protein n=1 Tax=Crepidotus variabilis TaxID=179855 RepID=A0A9P6JJX1_9AGAR|nr:kinase-like domain-containing protein [Crepidotus variabilis]
MTSFPEEQLDSAKGYFPGFPGMTLQSGKWTIICKLGWGERSSVWLVHDTFQQIKFRAIKIYTVSDSKEVTALNELRTFRLSDIKDVDVVQLQESFKEGSHLCLVFMPHGVTVEILRKSNAAGGYVAVHIAKQIAASTLTALSSLEDINLVHGASDHIVVGDLEKEDIMAAQIDTGVEQLTKNGCSYPLVRSQPIDPKGSGTTWNEPPVDFAGKSRLLVNLGHGKSQLSHRQTSNILTGSAAQPTQNLKALQAMKMSKSVPFPPEVLLGRSIALSSDVWQLGWMTFLLLTGTPLLNQDTYAKSPIESLNQILEPPFLENCLLCNATLLKEDLEPTVTLLRSLLTADPLLRPTVEDLLDNRWMQQGDICICGACTADSVITEH